MRLLKLAAITAVVIGISTAASARDVIRTVGSSTVFPFSTVVAENFGKTTSFATPVIESTGTGGGMKLFCNGIGSQHPDISNASRAIKKSELEQCAKNGITPIEVKIGYDGIVLANSREGTYINLSRRDIFLALAMQIPVNGKLVENPNVYWSDVRSDLPKIRIEVLGPPPTSGTRDAFVELVMEAGAGTFPEIAGLDKSQFRAVAHSIREDGAFIEAGENDNLIIQKLVANPDAWGIFGFSFLDQNMDKIQGVKIEGVDPTFEAISRGEYTVGRSLFFYVKKEHLAVIPGLREYVEYFISPVMIGEDSPAVDKGLIPLPAAEYNSLVISVKSNL